MLATAVTLALLASASAADGDARYAVEIVRAHSDGRGSVRGDGGFLRHHGVLPALAEDRSSPRSSRRRAPRDAVDRADSDDARVVVSRDAVLERRGGQLPRRRRDGSAAIPGTARARCCLAAGACARTTRRRVGGVRPRRPRTPRAWPPRRRWRAPRRPEAAAKMPAAALLGANASRSPADRPGRAAAATKPSLYRRAGAAGFEARCAPARRCWRASPAGSWTRAATRRVRVSPGERATPAGDRAARRRRRLCPAGCSRHGRGRRAAALFKELQRAGDVARQKRERRERGRAGHRVRPRGRAGGGAARVAAAFAVRVAPRRRAKHARWRARRRSSGAGADARGPATRWRADGGVRGDPAPARGRRGGARRRARSSARPRRRWRSRSSRRSWIEKNR